MRGSWFARPVAALLVATLGSAVWEGTAHAADGPIAASVARVALTESRRVEPAQQTTASASDRRGASLAEKWAFLFLFVSGIVFVTQSPGEKVDGKWTDDALSETLFGAGALGTSGWLFYDILKKRPKQP
jgi:hypothetical protein